MGGTGDDHDPVLDAVFMWFMRAGYGGFSMSEVAQAAGLPEREVSARGSRAELVVAALDRAVPLIPACPDTGSWRGDLLEAVHWQIDVLRIYWPIVERSLQTSQESKEYATTAREIAARRLRLYEPMFERAIARGDLDPALDFDSSVDLVLGPVYARHLGGRPTEHEHAEAIVDLALQGLTVASEHE